MSNEELSLHDRAHRAVALARESQGDDDTAVVGYLAMHVSLLEDLILNSMQGLTEIEQEGVRAYLLTIREPKDET